MRKTFIHTAVAIALAAAAASFAVPVPDERSEEQAACSVLIEECRQDASDILEQIKSLQEELAMRPSVYTSEELKTLRMKLQMLRNEFRDLNRRRQH